MYKNKFYFFIEFIIGFILLLISLFILFHPSMMIFSMRILGIIILFNGLYMVWKQRNNKTGIILSLFVGIILSLFPALPFTLFVFLFAFYICIKGLSQFITYYLYKQNHISYRFIILLSSLFLINFGFTYLLSPYIHLYQTNIIICIYLIYLALSFILKGIREIMGENRQNQMKRRIHVSLPVILNALIPRIMIDYINEKLETPSFIHTDGHNIDLTVFIHVSKNGFGAVGHVDISYQNIVYAYGAYDDLSNHLLGAIGDGVLFEVDESSYIDFCLKDDPQSVIFAYTLQLNHQQTQLIENNLQSLKQQLLPFELTHHQHTYAKRLQEYTHAQFYKFKKGRFQKYFVLTTNCVLLADSIIGTSGIDIIGINGMITPGSYYTYFEEEARKEYSRVYQKKIYASSSYHL